LNQAGQKPISKLLPVAALLVLVVISLAVWWKPLTSTFALALSDDQYTHILLILPVSLALIYLNWKSPGAPTRFSMSLGAFTLILATVITVVVRMALLAPHADEQLSLNMLALVGWWIGSFIFSFGTGSFRRAVFPLCFLLWMVPIPGFILNPAVRLLQDGSATAADLFFGMAGIPVAHEGTLITIPGLTIEVARECSSIRSSLMLVVTTMVLAQLLLRSPWRKAAVIALAFPLSVVKNGFRIFVLGMLGTRVDASFLTGRLHRQGGIIYFLLALILIFVALALVRRGELKMASAQGIPSERLAPKN